MTAYYNEFDPKAAAWLRELIKAGHIAPGDVDERSIVDIRPSDLIGYTQCHFFAGIGVWSHALRRAGWPDDRPVWTGSCPCQPFSAAGKGAGFTDERHLWPHFHWLIENCRPSIVFGEQVASKDGLGWLDLVQADLEGSGYASGAVDTCAAGFGAPHIRQRLYWVGKRLDDAASPRHDGSVEEPEGNSRHETRLRVSGAGSGLGGLENPVHSERRTQHVNREDGRDGQDGRREETHGLIGTRSEVRGPANAEGVGWGEQCADTIRSGERSGAQGVEQRSGSCSIRPVARPTNGFWRDADWLFCRDGKWRPVEPGTFPLAHGAAARVGRLRGYGNAIVAPAAQAFIEACLATEIMPANDNHCGVTFRPAA
ncbi:DNA (cytosine-5)-methyltransferase 1 [Ochrobactrum sp. 19YEA23]|uniref:DNA cytosine methyltransferase n=1 Tax=Ochrobactrum sp. 19YEA23 TaxID=3039854 RepID=UPI00247B0FE4|nr:DNA (cytosine-5)-methyltransferase 1 [Ochrobactrum sp. 19YEA23]